MTGRRLLELLAIGMIGEGMAGLLRPRRYLLLWRFGPRWYRKCLEGLAEDRRTMRLLCLAELTAGLWLSLRETETDVGAEPDRCGARNPGDRDADRAS